MNENNYSPRQKSRKLKPPSHDELAALWKNERSLTTFGFGRFHRYKYGFWQPVDEMIIQTEIFEILKRQKKYGINPSASLLNSITKLAQVVAWIEPSRWNWMRDYICFTNGVLYYPTRTFSQNSEDYYFTTGLGYEYSPTATCPNFMRALDTTIPQAKDFLQEFIGYALTMDTLQEIAVWLYGPPGCGKSTILTGIQAALGFMAGSLDLSSLQNSNFGLANLPGKTLLFANEQPSLYLKITSKLNSLISGELIRIEEKYKPAYYVIPHAKLIWAMNELPKIPSISNGLFRRVKVIEFPPLDESRKDTSLKKLVNDEGPGILNWALDGLDRLTKRGRFEIPTSVLESTNNFVRENDSPALFLEEYREERKNQRIQSSILHNAYKIWCEENKMEPISIHAIKEHWVKLKLLEKHINGKIYWEGF